MNTEQEKQQPTEEELRAAYEQEIKKIRVEHVLLDHVVTLINLGRRRTGIAPGTEAERDPEQVQLAIESIRAELPLIERSLPQQVAAIRDAVAQLQLAFVKIGGAAEQGAPDSSSEGAPAQAERSSRPEPAPPESGEPGPAQRSGRLWVPGQ